MKIFNEQNIPNIPWEDKPEGCTDVVWRSAKNPIVTRDSIKDSNSIFNSAVVKYGDKFVGIFRSDDTCRVQKLHYGESVDGINWDINDEPIKFIKENDEIGDFVYGYDPRLCKVEDKYYITWCNGYAGYPTIGLAETTDFKTFIQKENAFLPCNRNGVMFPRKVNGKFAMISRPSDRGHTAFGDIFYSQSPDLKYWGEHRHVMATVSGNWQNTKIGGGPTPIETEEGWLMIYHGVLTSCNGFTYCAGCAITDLEKPWIVKYRTKPYIMAPREIYECAGDVPNVVFPCSCLCDAETGRLAIYYGAADTVLGLAFTTVDELVKFTKENSF